MSETYNLFEGMDLLPYTIISHLFTNSDAEIIWKLLKYTTADAAAQANLTSAEKRALVYNGEEDSTPFSVFRDCYMDDGTSDQKTFLRVYTFSAVPENRTVGFINICFEVYTHPKISHLQNNKTRTDMIIQALLKVFNGSTVGGAGAFFFDADRSPTNMIKTLAYRTYQGKALIMGLNMV